MIFDRTHFSAMLELLRAGDPCILPSDTVYGISADPTNPAAVQAVQTLKKRNTEKPFVLLVPSFLEAEQLCQYSETARACLRKAQTPLTLVLPRKTAVLPDFFPHGSHLALRIVFDELLVKFLHLWGKPLLSTSVNLSGSAHLQDRDEIRKTFPDIPMFERDDFQFAEPSTIIQIDGDQQTVLRP